MFRIRGPVPFWPLDQGSGLVKKLRSGSGMNIRAHISEILEKMFGLKTIKLFYANPDPESFWPWGSGFWDGKFRIRDKHPGSATLIFMFRYWVGTTKSKVLFKFVAWQVREPGGHRAERQEGEDGAAGEGQEGEAQGREAQEDAGFSGPVIRWKGSKDFLFHVRQKVSEPLWSRFCGSQHRFADSHQTASKISGFFFKIRQ